MKVCGADTTAMKQKKIILNASSGEKKNLNYVPSILMSAAATERYNRWWHAARRYRLC